MAAAFIDLHCHTRASFDCLSAPAAVVKAAAERGLTHLAITDHDRIDGALEARELAPAGLAVIVGEEVKSADGDLICLFLDQAIPPGLSAAETIAATREQGGLVGIPHPFDHLRGSLLRDERLTVLGDRIDWVETHNARVVGQGNQRAAEFARERGLPSVAVSDAHSILEIGVAYTRLEREPSLEREPWLEREPPGDDDPSTAAGLLTALGRLAGVQLVPGRASLVIRAWTPVAKAVQRSRGNRRVQPMARNTPVDRGETR